MVMVMVMVMVGRGANASGQSDAAGVVSATRRAPFPSFLSETSINCSKSSDDAHMLTHR